jgi:hypothetical protein
MDKSPQEQKRIQKQVAYECAISLFDYIPDEKIGKDHDYKIATKFQQWIGSHGVDSNASVMASKALREAVRAHRYPVLNVQPDVGKSVDDILLKAEEIFKWFNV